MTAPPMRLLIDLSGYAATLTADEDWRRAFASATDAQRRVLVEHLRDEAHRRLDDLFHLLVFTGDTDTWENLTGQGTSDLSASACHSRPPLSSTRRPPAR
ncbi:hypothetical protein [Amycolatopsis orientalis]|uniref:hypothetical protein n=1 Tax=Amycolatopsis orientalis TaxID=31958 RepID=UPI0003A71977|nr:hypothetical protein [Amycolatopsis orientalis]